MMIDENEHIGSDGSWWRPLRTRNGVSIACMDFCDECDYDARDFLTEKKFRSRESAQAWIDQEAGKALRLAVELVGMVK